MKRKGALSAGSEETQTEKVGSSVTMRGAKIRFRRRMRTVGEICRELDAILDSLPTPDKEAIEHAISDGEFTSDLHFLGALNAAIFFLSEAKLMADEDKRYAKSKAEYFYVDPDVMKGLENVARLRCHLLQGGEEEAQEDPS